MIFSLPSGDNSRGFLSWFFTAGSCCLCLLLLCLSHKSSGGTKDQNPREGPCEILRSSQEQLEQHFSGSPDWGEEEGDAFKTTGTICKDICPWEMKL